MPAQASRRGVLLTVVIGCLLLLSGCATTGDRGGPPGTAGGVVGVSGDRAAGSQAAPAHVALPAAQLTGRPAAARMVTFGGHRPAGGSVQLDERAGSLHACASPGTGDDLVVGWITSRACTPAGGPSALEHVSAAAVDAPRAGLAARAPPAS